MTLAEKISDYRRRSNHHKMYVENIKFHLEEEEQKQDPDPSKILKLNKLLTTHHVHGKALDFYAQNLQRKMDEYNERLKNES